MAVSTAPAAPFISIENILGAYNLCGILQQTVSGVPNPFPRELFGVTDKVIGNTARFTQYTGQRQTARLTPRNAPSQNRSLKELGLKDIMLISSRENIILNVDEYQNLFAYDSLERQDLGKQEVARQIQQARITQDNLRISAVASVFFNGGQIYFDGSGNLLPTSSGAATSVNFNIPSGNLNQLNVLGQGNVIDSYWDSASSDIINQIVNLKQASVYLTGFEIKHAYYGRNILNFVANNTLCQAFLARSASASDREAQGRQILDSGEMPANFLGLTWHPCYTSMFLDNNNNVQSFVGDSAITFTPDYNPNWWRFIEGTAVVPKRFGATISPEGTVLRDNYDTIRGRYAYGVPITDPETAKIIYGDNFICGPSVPAAIFEAVVSLNS